MAKLDKITGFWTSNAKSREMFISFPDRTFKGFAFATRVSKKEIVGFMVEDKNKNNKYDQADPVVAVLKGNYSRNARILDLSSGKIVADEDTGLFSFFYKSKESAIGKFLFPQEFF
jgi:uncharacterized protein YfbU (UPF0304 family)